MVEDQMVGRARVRRRRVYRGERRAARVWGVAAWLLRRRRTALRGKSGHWLRLEPDRPIGQGALLPGDQGFTICGGSKGRQGGALGQTEAGGASELHGMDARRAVTPPPLPGLTPGQECSRGCTGAPVMSPKSENAARTGRRTVEITHPEKILFPNDGITKREFMEYYERIAATILPHLRERPIAMERYPDGIHGQK